MFRKLFNKSKLKNETENSLVDTNQLPSKKFRHILNTIREVCIQYINEKDASFIGISDVEIADLERKYELNFPPAYKYFLQDFAARQPIIFDGQSYNIKGIETAQEVSQEILLQDETTLPDNSFVFSQWQGYNFYYFINSGSDNPDTFLYIEGGNDNSANPPKIYKYGCFTDWLITLAINNVTIAGNLYGYSVEDGIITLKNLLTNSA